MRFRRSIGPASRTRSLAPQGFRSSRGVGSTTIDAETAIAEAIAFRQWLARDGEQRCTLVEMDFVDEVAGAPVTSTLHFADREFFDDVTNRAYVDVIRSAPQYSRMLSGERLGSYVSSIGSLELDNADGNLDFLLNIACDGCAIRFYYGGATWLVADFKLIFVAVVAKVAAPSFDRISVLLKDVGLLLDKSVGGEVIGGSGPNADRVSPITLGYIHNLTALLEDPATLKYRYTDFARLTSVLDVRDRGVPVAFTDNGDRTFTLSASPDGVITCDVLAEEDGIGNWRVAGAIRAIVGNKGGLIDLGLYAGPGPTFNVDDQDDYLLGTCITETRNILEWLADAIVSGNCFWAVTRTGLFTFGRLRLNDISSLGGVETIIREDDIDEGSFNLEHATPQYYKFRATMSRNWTEQTEFASSLTPEEQAIYSRPGLSLVQADGTGTSYAERPELYHKTMTVSPIIDTLLSQAFTGTDDIAALTRWMAVRKASFLPWVETVSITVGIEFFAIEIGDPVRLYNPRFGADDGVLFQLIGMVIRLTDAKCDLKLSRRNVIQPVPDLWVHRDPPHPDILLWVPFAGGSYEDISSYHHIPTPTDFVADGNSMWIYHDDGDGSGGTSHTNQVLYGPDANFDYIDGTPYTIEGFFEATHVENNTDPCLIFTWYTGTPDSTARKFQLYGGSAKVAYNDSGFGYEGGPSSSGYEGMFVHWAWVRPAGTGEQIERFYINGVQVFTYAKTLESTSGSGTARMAIGGVNNTNGGATHIVDVNIYETRVVRRNLYPDATPFTPPTPGHLIEIT